MPAGYVPKTQTEKALYNSLKEMELQCRERVDLLQALRASRDEAGPTYEENNNETAFSGGDQETGSIPVNEDIPAPPPGWSSERMAPTPNYPNSSQTPPPSSTLPPQNLPPRPSVDTPSRGSYFPPNTVADPGSLPLPPTLPVAPAQSPRAQSPERKPMLTTLRSREPKKSSSPSLAGTSSSSSRPTASKAAGLAWSSLARLTGSSSGAAQASANMGSGPSSGSLNKSYSNTNDREQQKRDSDISSFRSDTSKNTRTSYLSDIVRPQSTAEKSSSNLAADAAIAATQPSPEAEPLIDLSDTLSPSTQVPSPASPSSPGLSRPATRESNSSRNKAVLSKHTSRPDYLDPRPTRPQLRSPSHGQRTYSNSLPQLGRNKSDEVRAPGTHLAHSLGPTSYSRTREQKNFVTMANEEELRNRALESLYGPGANVDAAGESGVKQGKRATRQRSNTTPSANDYRPLEEETMNDSTGEPDDNIKQVMKNLPKGIDPEFAKQILNDIVIRGDEVHWDDVAGLETAKKALKEAVVYPFLRPDLFMGLREPARGMLLFGPPGTGKTMLARAVATESHSTFFSISASSLSSKWHGESEKLVRSLFALARAMAPSIIFVDEIDSLLSSRSSSSEGEASRRSKTEFLIQWSDLQRAAAGKEQPDKDKREGDPSRVLVLAATNMPWDIDEAARRRFVRRQYIPLPEPEVRKMQLDQLLSHQKHDISSEDLDILVEYTEGEFF